jgi:hypothetical protein
VPSPDVGAILAVEPILSTIQTARPIAPEVRELSVIDGYWSLVSFSDPLVSRAMDAPVLLSKQTHVAAKSVHVLATVAINVLLTPAVGFANVHISKKWSAPPSKY